MKFKVFGIITQEVEFEVDAEDELEAEEVADALADFDFTKSYSFEITSLGETGNE